MVIMVRHLIDDTTAPYTYTDDRLRTALIVSGIYVDNEYNFSTTYTFDLESLDISPDPAATATYDGIAMALITLKAACMIDINRYQTGVGNGIRVQDGDSMVDTTGSFKGFSDIIALGPCASYTKLLKSIGTKASMLRGRAIMSPISHVDYTVSQSNVEISRFFDTFAG